ncbi:MAG: GUN4 N-terminal ARM-like repeat domain-containing protein [Elainellaceae cyanobacterium]
MNEVQQPKPSFLTSDSPNDNLTDNALPRLRDRLLSSAAPAQVKDQIEAIADLASLGDVGLEVLMEFLRDRPSSSVDSVAGRAYQVLVQADTPSTQAFTTAQYPLGLVAMPSERDVDYSPLQTLLAQQDYQEADRLTLQKLCELAGAAAVQRKWLYFSEVDSFPATDLRTVDRLWRVFSGDRFGFSIQRDLWLAVNKDWDRLWPRIGWKSGNTWTRYPNQFTWDLSAPKGHLPLSNQLRGVRVMASLLGHPAWS